MSYGLLLTEHLACRVKLRARVAWLAAAVGALGECLGASGSPSHGRSGAPNCGTSPRGFCPVIASAIWFS
jgi:hypothetical protein